MRQPTVTRPTVPPLVQAVALATAIATLTALTTVAAVPPSSIPVAPGHPSETGATDRWSGPHVCSLRMPGAGDLLGRGAAPDPGDDRGFDVAHYDLDIALDIDGCAVAGEVTISGAAIADGLDAIVLDLHDALNVVDVSGPGVAGHTHADDHLTVDLASPLSSGEAFTVTVAYAGQPPDIGGPIAQPPVTCTAHDGSPLVFTLSVPDRSGAWWPCKEQLEDKATIDLHVTVPDGLVVAANGRFLLDEPTGDGRRRFHFSHGHPVAPYLVAVSVTNYAVVSDSVRIEAPSAVFASSPTLARADSVTVPLVYYVYPELETEATADFVRMPEAMRYLSDLFGPYPFADEKYGMAMIGGSGGMEHQTISAIGRGFITGDLRNEWAFVHELSHQWVGDWVTVRDWRDVWLNEGFASYVEALWEEHTEGTAAYHTYMNRLDSFAPPYGDGFYGPIYDPSPLYGPAPYDKGAWVLHMLRHVVGDETFFDILPTYIAARANGNTSTADFQAACESVSGRSFQRFFDQWLYPAGRPLYRMSWGYEPSASVSGAHDVVVWIEQTQAHLDVYEMPIDLVIVTSSGSDAVRVENTARRQRFVIPVDGTPLAVEFDPDRWLLRNDPIDTIGAPPIALLRAPAPNPLRTESLISYALPDEGRVTLRVYDTLGRKVRTLVDGRVQTRNQSVLWDGRDDAGRKLASGVYYVRLVTPGGDETSRVVVSR